MAFNSPISPLAEKIKAAVAQYFSPEKPSARTRSKTRGRPQTPYRPPVSDARMREMKERENYLKSIGMLVGG